MLHRNKVGRSTDGALCSSLAEASHQVNDSGQRAAPGEATGRGFPFETSSGD
jgi:hypothetical protein